MNRTGSSSDEPRTDWAMSKDLRLGIDKGSQSKVVLCGRDLTRNCSPMKRFERIVGARLRESRLCLLLIPAALVQRRTFLVGCIPTGE